MTDLKVTYLVLGQGVIGSYLADRFEKEKIDYAVLDVGVGINALIKASSTTSNVNSNLNNHRNSFLSKDAMTWGRGLMVVPQSEFDNLNFPIEMQTLNRSIDRISEKFLGRNLESFKPYKIKNEIFIDTLYVPPAVHQRFYYKKKKPAFQNHIALSISPVISGYDVDALDLISGQKIKINAKKIFVTIGAIEAVRLLLNSPNLFEGEETGIGKNLCDHVTMASVSVQTSNKSELRHLSPKSTKVRIHPRFYHDPGSLNGLGGFSFIDFNPAAMPESFMKRFSKRITRYELSPGSSIAKTLMETENSNQAFIEIRADPNGLIPHLRINFNVSDFFVNSFQKAMTQFINHLGSLNVDFDPNLEKVVVEPSKMFDSLHPTGVIPFRESPKSGEFGPDFQLNNHEGIYCFSTGMLPRAFSVQPTLTALAFADVYLTRSFESI